MVELFMCHLKTLLKTLELFHILKTSQFCCTNPLSTCTYIGYHLGCLDVPMSNGSLIESSNILRKRGQENWWYQDSHCYKEKNFKFIIIGRSGKRTKVVSAKISKHWLLYTVVSS